MTRKEKKISFRINEEKFSQLEDLANEKNFSLSDLFREYANKFKKYDGNLSVVTDSDLVSEVDDYEGREYPPKVRVPTTMIREHERLELETEHLRESLDEVKAHKHYLESQISDNEIVSLESIDEANGNID